jgi:uncharacterized membrane protein YqjE
MLASGASGHMIEIYGYTVTLNVTVVLYVLSSLSCYWSYQHMEKRDAGTVGWVLTNEEVA